MSKKLGFALSGLMLAMVAGTASADYGWWSVKYQWSGC